MPGPSLRPCGSTRNKQVGYRPHEVKPLAPLHRQPRGETCLCLAQPACRVAGAQAWPFYFTQAGMPPLYWDAAELSGLGPYYEHLRGLAGIMVPKRGEVALVSRLFFFSWFRLSPGCSMLPNRFQFHQLAPPLLQVTLRESIVMCRLAAYTPQCTQRAQLGRLRWDQHSHLIRC